MIIYILSLLVFIFQIILIKYAFKSSYINFSPTLRKIFQDHISRREKGVFEFAFLFEDHIFFLSRRTIVGDDSFRHSHHHFNSCVVNIEITRGLDCSADLHTLFQLRSMSNATHLRGCLKIS